MAIGNIQNNIGSGSDGEYAVSHFSYFFYAHSFYHIFFLSRPFLNRPNGNGKQVSAKSLIRGMDEIVGFRLILTWAASSPINGENKKLIMAWLFLTVTIGLVNYETVYALFVEQKYEYDAGKISIIITVGALIGIIVQVWLLDRFIR